MKKLILHLLMLMYIVHLGAQAPSIYSTDACGQTHTGVLNITWNHDLSRFPLPYSGEYFNEDSGDFNNFQVDSNIWKIANLFPGEYTFKIKLDSVNTMEFCGIIQNTNSLEVIASIQNSCTNNGIIDLHTSGGESPYKYEWSNDDTTSEISNLDTGNYLVTILDQNGCFKDTAFRIDKYNDFNIVRDLSTPQFNQDACFGSLGKVTIKMESPIGANSGTDYPNDSIVWSNGTIGRRLIASSGEYVVTVTDIWGCSSTQSFIIDSESFQTTEISRNDIVDCSDQFGDIFINTTPIGRYDYEWSNGSFEKDLLNAPSGNYSVTTKSKDQFGNTCQNTISLVELEPLCCQNGLEVAATVTKGIKSDSITGTGKIKFTISGGSGNYAVTLTKTHSGEEVQMTSNYSFENLVQGNYRLTIIDEDSNCTFTGTYFVSNKPCNNELEFLFTDQYFNFNCGSGGTNYACDGPNVDFKIHLTASRLDDVDTLVYPIIISLIGPNSFNSEVIINSEPELLQVFSATNNYNYEYCLERSTEPYIWGIKDGCENYYSDTIKTCIDCSTLYFDQSNKDRHRYRFANQFKQPNLSPSQIKGLFGIDIARPCKYWNGSFGIDTKVQVVNTRKSNKSEGLLEGIGYKITWPDGRVVTVKNSDGKIEWTGGGNAHFWEPTKQQYRDNGPYRVVIERLDRECKFEIDVFFGQQYNNIVIQADPNFGNAITCHSTCKGGCNSDQPSIAGYLFDCPAGADLSRFKPFEYSPNDLSNPCTGGGYVRHIDWDDEGNLVNVLSEIPEYTTYFDYSEPEFIIGCSTGCQKGGGCLVDGSILYPNFPGSIYLNYCLIKNEGTIPFDTLAPKMCITMSCEPNGPGVNILITVPDDISFEVRTLSVETPDGSFSDIVFVYGGETRKFYINSLDPGTVTATLSGQDLCEATISCEAGGQSFTDPDPPTERANCSDVLINNIYDPSIDELLNLRQNILDSTISISTIEVSLLNETDKFDIDLNSELIAKSIYSNENIVVALKGNGVNLSEITVINKNDLSIADFQFNQGNIQDLEIVNDTTIVFTGEDIQNNPIEGSFINGVSSFVSLGNREVVEVFTSNNTIYYLVLNQISKLYELCESTPSNVVATLDLSVNSNHINSIDYIKGIGLVAITNDNKIVLVNISTNTVTSKEYTSQTLSLKGAIGSQGSDLIVYGDFSDSIDLDGNLLSSNGHRDIIFLTMNQDLKITDLKQEGAENDEIIKGAEELRDNLFSYFGEYTLNTTLDGNLLVTDSICEFIITTEYPVCDSCLIDCAICTDCELCPDCPQCEECVSCTDCSLCPDCPQCDECADCTDCTQCPQCTDCDVDCTTCTDCNLCPNCPDCENVCDSCADCSVCPWCIDCDPNGCPQLIGFEIDMSPGNGIADISLHMPINSSINVTLYELTSLGWVYVSSDNFGPSGPGVVDIVYGIDGLHDKDLKFVFECISCPDCPPLEHEFNTGPDIRNRTIDNGNGLVMVDIYPNPTINAFTVDFTADENDKVEVFIINVSGVQIFEDEIFLAKGRNRYHIKESEEWGNGLYYFVYKARGSVMAKKIVKIR